MNKVVNSSMEKRYINGTGFNYALFHEDLISMKNNEIVKIFLQSAGESDVYQKFMKNKKNVHQDTDKKWMAFCADLVKELNEIPGPVLRMEGKKILLNKEEKLSPEQKDLWNKKVPIMKQLTRLDYEIRGLNKVDMYRVFKEDLCQEAKGAGVDIASYGYDDAFFAQGDKLYDICIFEDCEKRLKMFDEGSSENKESMTYDDNVAYNFRDRLQFYKDHGGDTSIYEGYEKKYAHLCKKESV